MPHVGKLHIAGTQHHEPVFGDPRNGQIARNTAFLGQHRRQRHAPDLRHPVGQNPVQPGLGARTADLELGQGRELHQPDFVADALAFVGDRLPPVRLPVGQAVFRRHALWREPVGMLKPEGCAKDTACLF